MYDALRVSGTKRVRDLERYTDRFGKWQRTSSQPRGQSLAAHVLHDQVFQAILISYVVNGADVWMIQRRDGASLALEALAHGSVTGARPEEFHSYGAVETRVFRLIDGAYAARA